jgi:hypothetical protein
MKKALKRLPVVVEMGGVFGAGGPGELFMASGRVLGEQKKTGQIWVKSAHFRTRLFDRIDLLGLEGRA